MKIVHVISGLNVGGAERLLERLLLLNKSSVSMVISLTDIGTIGSGLRANGIDVRCVSIHLNPFSGIVRLWWILRQERPDVLQTWMYHADFLGGLIGWALSIKNIVWNIRCTEPPGPPWARTKLLAYLCAATSHVLPRKIICCSHSALTSHAQMGYKSSKLVVVPNGFDSSRFSLHKTLRSDSRAEYGILSTCYVIGFVGRFDPIKGHSMFVEASRYINEKARGQCLFLMAGNGVDRSNERLMSLIEKNAPSAKFLLVGETLDIRSIFSCMDVFCLSSLSEGFPNVLGEAMLMELPCVSTNVGDAARLIGNCGRIIYPNDPKALATAVITMLQRSEIYRRRLGRLARKRIMRKFDIQRTLQEYLRVYNDIP